MSDWLLVFVLFSHGFSVNFQFSSFHLTVGSYFADHNVGQVLAEKWNHLEKQPKWTWTCGLSCWLWLYALRTITSLLIWSGASGVGSLWSFESQPGELPFPSFTSNTCCIRHWIQFFALFKKTVFHKCYFFAPFISEFSFLNYFSLFPTVSSLFPLSRFNKSIQVFRPLASPGKLKLNQFWLKASSTTLDPVVQNCWILLTFQLLFHVFSHSACAFGTGVLGSVFPLENVSHLSPRKPVSRDLSPPLIHRAPV